MGWRAGHPPTVGAYGRHHRRRAASSAATATYTRRMPWGPGATRARCPPVGPTCPPAVVPQYPANDPVRCLYKNGESLILKCPTEVATFGVDESRYPWIRSLPPLTIKVGAQTAATSLLGFDGFGAAGGAHYIDVSGSRPGPPGAAIKVCGCRRRHVTCPADILLPPAHASRPRRCWVRTRSATRPAGPPARPPVCAAVPQHRCRQLLGRKLPVHQRPAPPQVPARGQHRQQGQHQHLPAGPDRRRWGADRGRVCAPGRWRRRRGRRPQHRCIHAWPPGRCNQGVRGCVGAAAGTPPAQQMLPPAQAACTRASGAGGRSRAVRLALPPAPLPYRCAAVPHH